MTTDEQVRINYRRTSHHKKRRNVRREVTQRTKTIDPVCHGVCRLQCTADGVPDFNWRSDAAIRNVSGRRRPVLPGRAGIQADKPGGSSSPIQGGTGTAPQRPAIGNR